MKNKMKTNQCKVKFSTKHVADICIAIYELGNSVVDCKLFEGKHLSNARKEVNIQTLRLCFAAEKMKEIALEGQGKVDEQQLFNLNLIILWFTKNLMDSLTEVLREIPESKHNTRSQIDLTLAAADKLVRTVMDKDGLEFLFAQSMNF